MSVCVFVIDDRLLSVKPQAAVIHQLSSASFSTMHLTHPLTLPAGLAAYLCVCSCVTDKKKQRQGGVKCVGQGVNLPTCYTRLQSTVSGSLYAGGTGRSEGINTDLDQTSVGNPHNLLQITHHYNFKLGSGMCFLSIQIYLKQK